MGGWGILLTIFGISVLYFQFIISFILTGNGDMILNFHVGHLAVAIFSIIQYCTFP